MSLAPSSDIVGVQSKAKPYPTYKDSGVEWLGKIPARWEVKRIKYIARLSYGDSLSAESREDGAVQVFGSNGPVGFHSQPNTLGPTLVIGRKGSFGKVSFSAQPCFAIDTTYFIDSRQTKEDLRWVFYALEQLRLDAISRDSAVPGLEREFAHEQCLPVPSAPEQHAIAAFLDRETAKIDALVKKKERLIELLQEKRTAIISQGVTKGLDPNVPMKDSGVEWLGKIPVHWEVKRLKHIAQLGSGEAITSSQIEETGDFPVYGGNGLRGYTSSFTHEGKFPLIGRQGALCGCITYAQGRFWASEHAVVATPRPGHVAKWLAELLRSMNLNQYSQSAAQPGLAVETIMDILVPVAPVEEQHAIAAFIDSETAKIDSLIAKVREGIERLKEYRTALISAAVTGKIDVRAEFPGNDHASASADVT